MSRVVGVITLIGAVWLAAWPSAERVFGQPVAGTTDSAKRLRRDLGEKGQIVIESLDLDNADIENVVRFLARIAGINIITGDLSGAITVYLENVTVQDALEAILASQGYGFIFDGNIVRIVDAAQLGEDRVETITETFILNYLPAQKVADTLKSVFQGGGLGGATYSQIEANIEANAIIAVDIPRKMEDIRRLIHFLDRRFEQVEIEGRFIEISYSQEQEWGVDWRFFTDPANTFDVNLAPQPLNANNVAGQFKFAVINGDTNFTGFIQMLESQDDIKVLASPKILAIENEEAEIALINEEPFVEANVSQGVITESVQFQETGIRLLVTPTIAQEADGTFVTMNLDLEQRIRGPNVVLNNSIAFPVDSRRAVTTLVVPDDSTVIIGGLKSDGLQYTYEKVPFLGSVPLLGAAFRRRAKTDDQRELVLFVTPRVIYDHPPLDMTEQERHDDVDRVMDVLERHSEWRERVEAPIDMIDKGILYSNEVQNSDTYDRIQQVNDCIEEVKPYKISKPKGERILHVLGDEGGVRQEYEYVDDGQGLPSEEAADSSMEGEVKDFSIIEEEAGKAAGRSDAGWYNEERREERQEEETSAPPPPPPQAPATTPPAQEPEGDRPSWLRRGARNTSRDRSSDAGHVEGPLETDKSLDEAVVESGWQVPGSNPDQLSEAEMDELLETAYSIQEAAQAASSAPVNVQSAADPEEAPVRESEVLAEGAETDKSSEMKGEVNPWGIETELVAETVPLELDEPTVADPWTPVENRVAAQPPTESKPHTPNPAPSVPVGAPIVPDGAIATAEKELQQTSPSPPAAPQRIVLSETLKAKTEPKPVEAPVIPPENTQETRPVAPVAKPVKDAPKVEKVDLRASALGLNEPPDTDFRKYLDPGILATMEQFHQRENPIGPSDEEPVIQVAGPFPDPLATDPWEVRPEAIPSMAYPADTGGNRFLAQNDSPIASPATQTTPRIEVPTSTTVTQAQPWWRRLLGKN
jgi:type II secretory pathway component GspD/PulD (secretin)